MLVAVLCAATTSLTHRAAEVSRNPNRPALRVQQPVCTSSVHQIVMEEVFTQWGEGAVEMAAAKIPITTIAQTLGCSRHTIYKALPASEGALAVS